MYGAVGGVWCALMICSAANVGRSPAIPQYTLRITYGIEKKCLRALEPLKPPPYTA